MRTKLVEVKNLKQYFSVGGNNVVKAVDGVSFTVYEGETLGLVGESGCGKSTTGRMIVGLYEVKEGVIYYRGEDVSKKRDKSWRKKVQMIFQDPYSALNPRMRVVDIVAEGIDIHGLVKNKEERFMRVVELLELVGLKREHAMRYPHEFSGGQRQRIGIARALAVEPEFIIADEVLSALDVSIQAQIVNLLKELQERKKITFLFIAHDLSMVKYFSDRIGVMYKGRLVELATSDELYDNPLHPYTKMLLSCVPTPDPKYERMKKWHINERFHLNFDDIPDLKEVSSGHWVAL